MRERKHKRNGKYRKQKEQAGRQRAKKQRVPAAALAGMLAAALILVLGILIAVPAVSAEPEEKAKPLVIEPPQKKMDLSQITSYAGILIRLEDGKVLTQFHEDEKIFPASLTKIMTCIVAIENARSLEDTAVVTQETYDEMYLQNASVAGFLPGEETRVIDLLYGNILPSGGECSVTLAEYTAGSEEAFVKLMNQKAEELGMDGTHYVNSVGLHDEAHYSTVKDIGTLLRYALDNETFREIFCAKEYTVPPTNMHPGGFAFGSSVFYLREDWTLSDGQIDGGKTGFTDEAGLCLATKATVGGREYIVVTAKAQGDYTTEPYHVYDAFCLYNQI